MYICMHVYVCVCVCVCVCMCMYVCSPCSIELNTHKLFISISFIEDDDYYESLLCLVVVTLIINLFIILFKLIMSMRVYITISNFVAVCFWLATFRK